MFRYIFSIKTREKETTFYHPFLCPTQSSHQGPSMASECQGETGTGQMCANMTPSLNTKESIFSFTQFGFFCTTPMAGIIELERLRTTDVAMNRATRTSLVTTTDVGSLFYLTPK